MGPPVRARGCLPESPDHERLDYRLLGRVLAVGAATLLVCVLAALLVGRPSLPRLAVRPPKAVPWGVGLKQTATYAGSAAAGSLADASRMLREERARTRAERDSFAAFGGRVAALDATAAPDAGDGGLAMRGAPDERLQAVRDAYRETVMDVPHYEEEYGETLERHMAASMDPELAAAVTGGDAFTPVLKRRLVAAADRCQQQRERFLSVLGEERDALAEAGARLDDLEARLESVRSTVLRELTFAELVETYADLEAAGADCERLLEERQRQRTGGHADFGTDRVEVPDLQSYLYRSLPTTYPVLSRGTELLEALAGARRRVTAEASWRF